MICYHCGSSFTDPYIEALHAALPADVPMERHGEDGEMIELTLRKYHGGLS